MKFSLGLFIRQWDGLVRVKPQAWVTPGSGLASELGRPRGEFLKQPVAVAISFCISTFSLRDSKSWTFQKHMASKTL